MAIYYERQATALTARIMALTEQIKQARETADSLAKRQVQEHEREREQILADVDRSNAELERVRDELRVAKERNNTAAPGECRGASAEVLGHIERGTDLATRCAQELAQSQQALKTCVKMYGDLQSVYDPAK